MINPSDHDAAIRVLNELREEGRREGLLQAAQQFVNALRTAGFPITIDPQWDGRSHLMVTVRELHDMNEIGERSYNCLLRNKVHTISDLLGKTEQDLLDIANFGQKCLDEVKEALSQRGLSLKS